MAWPSTSALLFLVWLSGVTFVLAAMSAGLMHVRRVRQNSLPWREGQAVVADVAAALSVRKRIHLLVTEAVVGPMTCGVIRPAIILPRNARAWRPEDLHRAIVHEVEHIRRGDWLMLCLARIVCALYWFHPFIWISWRQLRLEAERACDDAVLRSADAEAYADQLIALAERLVSSRAHSVLAMANRGDLSARVCAVLDERRPRGPARSRWIAASAGGALLLLVGIAPLRAVAEKQIVAEPIVTASATERSQFASARSAAPVTTTAQPALPLSAERALPQQQRASSLTTPTPRFEVASVRPNKSGDVNRRITMGSPESFTATNITVRLLINDAFRHPSGRLRREYEIIGGPDWIESEGFDVMAKASTAVSETDLRQMLQSLLVDRFGLKIHAESRELTAYALVRSRADGQLGPQLQPSTGECRPFAGRGAAPQPDAAGPAARLCGFAGRGGPGGVNAVAVTMTQLANVLANQVGREVVDQTDLPGIFDLALQFIPQRRLPFATVALPEPPPDAPSIFTAVQEQLGLKLEARRMPMEVLIIDSVERPTEN